MLTAVNVTLRAWLPVLLYGTGDRFLLLSVAASNATNANAAAAAADGDNNAATNLISSSFVSAAGYIIISRLSAFPADTRRAKRIHNWQLARGPGRANIGLAYVIHIHGRDRCFLTNQFYGL